MYRERRAGDTLGHHAISTAMPRLPSDSDTQDERAGVASKYENAPNSQRRCLRASLLGATSTKHSSACVAVDEQPLPLLEEDQREQSLILPKPARTPWIHEHLDRVRPIEST